MSKFIAIDVDEVLAQTIDTILKYHNYTINGKSISYEKINNYDVFELDDYNITKEQARKIFFITLYFSSYGLRVKKIDGAKDVLIDLYNSGHELHIITARSNFLWFGRITKYWLKKNFGNIFSSINFTNTLTSRARSRLDVCKMIGTDYIIEDNLETCIECVESGIKAYLLDRPWNQDYSIHKHKGITKVYSRDEVII